MAPQPSLVPFPERLTEEVLGVLQSTSSISSGKHTLSFTQLDGGNILVVFYEPDDVEMTKPLAKVVYSAQITEWAND